MDSHTLAVVYPTALCCGQWTAEDHSFWLLSQHTQSTACAKAQTACKETPLFLPGVVLQPQAPSSAPPHPATHFLCKTLCMNEYKGVNSGIPSLCYQEEFE